MKHRFLYIYAAFVTSLSVLVILAILFSQQLGFMIKFNRSVDDAYKVIYKIQSLEAYLNSIETSAASFMLTNDSMYLQPLVNQAQTINAAIDTLKTMTSDSEKKRNQLSLLHSSIRQRINVLNQIIARYASKDTSGLNESLVRSKYLMDALHNEIRNFQNEELEKLNENYEKKISRRDNS